MWKEKSMSQLETKSDLMKSWHIAMQLDQIIFFCQTWHYVQGLDKDLVVLIYSL